MAEYIEREAVLNDIGELFTLCRETLPNEAGHHFIVEKELETHLDFVRNLPAADVRPVVLCGVCELHGHCYTEDVFAFARLSEENRFCAVGKVKTNGKKREES